MNKNNIEIRKARVHNLKDVSTDIPKNSFVVITGPSGSGKSSLAFDTLYIEGQRRYIESLSSYARQFLGQFQPPDVESISGLSPSIAIDQKSISRNPRSTVGTITEINDYLRIMFAKIGTTYCPECNKKIVSQTPKSIEETIIKNKADSKIIIMSPVIRNRKGAHKDLISKYQSMGYNRIRIDGKMHLIDDDIKINKNTHHNIDLIIDRIVLKKEKSPRLIESIEQGLKISQGFLSVLINEKEYSFSEHHYCTHCKLNFPALEPRSFSFNSPLGACELCNGLGVHKSFDKNLMILDPNLSILDGALIPLKSNSFLFQMIKDVAKTEKVDLDKPLNKLNKKFLEILFDGSSKIYKYNFSSENSNFNFKKSFPGLSTWLEKKYLETGSDSKRAKLEEFMTIKECSECNGQRLNKYSLATKISNYNINDICSLPLDECQEVFKKLKLSNSELKIAEKLTKEINNRLSFLNDVGLSYLNLNRSAATLSGGEAQRIRLATQIGSALSGVIYVLDEPSIGLHQKDNEKLIETLVELKNLGNTVIVVEHDEATMLKADHIIDMGPGAGEFGGEIISEGNPKVIMKNKDSVTGRFLAQTEKIKIPQKRKTSQESIFLKGANLFNLKKIDVEFPLNILTCITGVSGSGKSTLIHKILVPAIKEYLNKSESLLDGRNYKSISNVNKINSIIELDQTPIGRTPRSNPATYSGLFDHIRTLFSSLPESKIRGYKPGRFSFNVKGGRCDSCEGDGLKKIEMHFLPDVYVTCEICGGKRYNEETLSILFKGKNIADIFEMSVTEALEFFANQPRIKRILQTLNDVGLGYIKLGQSATTLSGGEAQRLKLSKELAKKPRGNCLYILDEPTTGLHFYDIKILLAAINRLIENGHSVLIIEHNLDVIKTADWIIDLGPEGGEAGGEIIATGTPEKVAKTKKSYTGKFLNDILK